MVTTLHVNKELWKTVRKCVIDKEMNRTMILGEYLQVDPIKSGLGGIRTHDLALRKRSHYPCYATRPQCTKNRLLMLVFTLYPVIRILPRKYGSSVRQQCFHQLLGLPNSGSEIPIADNSAGPNVVDATTAPANR